MFITRPFYCNNHEAHRKASYHVVWGTSRQSLVVYSIKNRIICNITPHIVSFKKVVYGHVPIAITCGIDQCGVDIYRENGILKIDILDVKTLVLEAREFQALLKFKNTGYEI